MLYYGVNYCVCNIYSIFQILDNSRKESQASTCAKHHPKSLAARLCQSLGADAERRVVQLSFTGCFNFSAPDVVSGSQVVGVFNAKLPGI